jgi:hypothetical protein
MSLRLVEIRPRPMASTRPLGLEARPLCMLLMIGWPPVSPTLGHCGNELPDVLQSPLGKGLARSPRDPVASMFQRRGRFLPDDEGPVQLALVVLRARAAPRRCCFCASQSGTCSPPISSDGGIVAGPPPVPPAAPCAASASSARRTSAWKADSVLTGLSSLRRTTSPVTGPVLGGSSSSTRTPTCSASVRPWYRGSLGPYSPRSWGNAGRLCGACCGCLGDLAAAPSGARPPSLLFGGRSPLALGLETRERAAHTAFFLLSVDRRPGCFPLSPGSGRRVPLPLGGGAQLRPFLREDGKGV